MANKMRATVRSDSEGIILVELIRESSVHDFDAAVDCDAWQCWSAI